VNIGKVFKAIFVIGGNLVLVEPKPAFTAFAATDGRLDSFRRFPQATPVFCWYQHQFVVIALERDVVSHCFEMLAGSSGEQRSGGCEQKQVRKEPEPPKYIIKREHERTSFAWVAWETPVIPEATSVKSASAGGFSCQSWRRAS